MNEILQFLNDHPLQYLATVGLDEKPKIRPFQYMLNEQGKLWFCTGSHKKVYAELTHNPFTELSVCSPKGTWMRLSGKAVFAEDTKIKNKILSQNSLVKSIYKSPENPNFKVFFLDACTAVLADLSGNPPREIQLNQLTKQS